MLFKKIIGGYDISNVGLSEKDLIKELTEVELFLEHLDQTRFSVKSISKHLKRSYDELNTAVNIVEGHDLIIQSLAGCLEASSVLLSVLGHLNSMETEEKELLKLMLEHPLLNKRPEFMGTLRRSNIEDHTLTDDKRIIMHAIDFYAGFYSNTFMWFYGELNMLRLYLKEAGSKEPLVRLKNKLVSVEQVASELIIRKNNVLLELKKARQAIVDDKADQP